jgi:prophage regulatory protein
MSNGEFPKSISLGGRAVGWLESDINEWLEQCIEATKK